MFTCAMILSGLPYVKASSSSDPADESMDDSMMEIRRPAHGSRSKLMSPKPNELNGQRSYSGTKLGIQLEKQQIHKNRRQKYGPNVDLSADEREEKLQRDQLYIDYKEAEKNLMITDARTQRIHQNRQEHLARLGHNTPSRIKYMVWKETPILEYTGVFGYQYLKVNHQPVMKQPGDVIYNSYITRTRQGDIRMCYWDITHKQYLYIKCDALLNLGIGTQMELLESDGMRKQWMIYKVLADREGNESDGTGRQITIPKDSYVQAFYSSSKKDATKRPFFKIKTGKNTNVKIAFEDYGNVPTLDLCGTKEYWKANYPGATLFKLKK